MRSFNQPTEKESAAYTLACALALIATIIIFYIGLDVLASFMPGQE